MINLYTKIFIFIALVFLIQQIRPTDTQIYSYINISSQYITQDHARLFRFKRNCITMVVLT
jgi:hypothetical protein